MTSRAPSSTRCLATWPLFAELTPPAAAHTWQAMKAVIQCVKERPAYFAERLFHSMKYVGAMQATYVTPRRGVGTDDETLVRIVVARAEIDMVRCCGAALVCDSRQVEIKQAFFDKFNKSLGKMIEAGLWCVCVPRLMRAGRHQRPLPQHPAGADWREALVRTRAHFLFSKTRVHSREMGENQGQIYKIHGSALCPIIKFTEVHSAQFYNSRKCTLPNYKIHGSALYPIIKFVGSALWAIL